MSNIFFYGVKSRYGREVSAKGILDSSPAAVKFSNLTPRLLGQIPALDDYHDVRDGLEILLMHPIYEINRQVPTECLEEALKGVQPDTRGMSFVSREFEQEIGKRPDTLAALLPYFRESINAFGLTQVHDNFAFPSSGTKSTRVYLEGLFHYGGTKPLSLIFDCFIRRDNELDRLRLSFSLGKIVDENSTAGYRSFIDS